MTADFHEIAPEPDRLVEVRPLAQALRAFAQARDWEQFHSPKNLAMALTGEVGELVEVFQWMTEEASRGAAQEPKVAQALRHELADVLLYLVGLADVLGVDLNAAVHEKLQINAAKYPVEQAKGSSAKYTEL
ncbi:nucleotide pyrophosphohydrolase [Caldimonas tepidiphila]|uniref:nucleotide pyrophosphohydrolase n=1 Tax=Caldimonas tepidiphila TaxID=2315841 RepID=UPI000E5BEE3C|nr:nucleotide pyrophosphohydrolase [Caldimonas tepidiphila]